MSPADDAPNTPRDSKASEESQQRDVDVRYVDVKKEAKELVRKKLKSVHQQIIAPPGE